MALRGRSYYSHTPALLSTLLHQTGNRGDGSPTTLQHAAMPRHHHTLSPRCPHQLSPGLHEPTARPCVQTLCPSSPVSRRPVPVPTYLSAPAPESRRALRRRLPSDQVVIPSTVRTCNQTLQYLPAALRMTSTACNPRSSVSPLHLNCKRPVIGQKTTCSMRPIRAPCAATLASQVRPASPSVPST